MTLVAMLDSVARKNAERSMIAAAGRSWTYREVMHASQRAATHLHSIGVEAGDRVAIMAFNTPEFVVATIATWRLGATLVPVNHKLSAAELRYILDHSAARILLAAATLMPVARDAAGTAIVVPLEGECANHFSVDGPADANDNAGVELVDPVAPAEILYTSGTTGKPKGCVHSHRSVLNTAMLSSIAFGMTPFDRTLIAMPIWHAAPLNNFMMSTLFVGGCLVLMREYEPAGFVQTLQDQRVSVFFGAPVAFTLPLTLPGGIAGYNLSSVRALLYGGGPISAEVATSLAAAYHTDRFYQVYGMTETGPGGTLLYPHEQLLKPGSIGRAAQPGVDLRIVRTDGEPAAAGDVGEIWLRSDSLMTGYLDDPAATAAAIDGDWYKTGDLVRVDDDGYMFVVDRLKDMIITGGENVYSKEVEDALHAVVQPVDCAVIGLPHPEWGETVVAALVLRADVSLDEVAVRAALRDQLAAYKIPRRFVVLDALPRTPTGKVVKGALRDLLTLDSVIPAKVS